MGRSGFPPPLPSVARGEGFFTAHKAHVVQQCRGTP